MASLVGQLCMLWGAFWSVNMFYGDGPGGDQVESVTHWQTMVVEHCCPYRCMGGQGAGVLWIDDCFCHVVHLKLSFEQIDG